MNVARIESIAVDAADGQRLSGWRWPAATPRAVLLIVHGMAEHAGRYHAFARTLAARGIEVRAFDLRGHGRTTPAIDHGHLGTTADWSTLVADVECARAQASQQIGALPLFLFGHSLGSFIAQRVAQTRGARWAGLILSGCDSPSRLTCRLGALLAALESARVDATGRSALLQWWMVKAHDRRLRRRLGRRLRADAWLSRVDAEVDAYRADPACGFALRTRAWQRILTGIARTHSAHAQRAVPGDLPTLLIAGGEDPMGGFGRGPRRLARRLAGDGQRDVELRVYAGARHELLHERVAQQVSADVYDWLERRIAAIRAVPAARD